MAERRTLAARLRLRVWVPPLVAFVLVGLGWQLYARAHPFVVPSLGRIFGSLRDEPGLYWDNARVTLEEIGVGAALGIGAALVIAIVMAELPIVENALMPLAVVLNVTPIVAIAPGLVVAFGFGSTPKYVVTAIVVFFPFLVNALAGLRDVDPGAVDVLRTLHASRLEILWQLRLPGSLPYLFAGLRIALPLAVVGAVVAEIAAAGQASGLGALVTTAASQSDLPTIWAAILLLAVLGVLLTVLVALVQARLSWWGRDRRAGRPRR